MSKKGASADTTFRFPPVDPARLSAAPVYSGEIVDVHTHLFPRTMFVAIRKWFAKAGWDIPYPHETDEVVGMLRDWGVTENWALAYAHKPGIAEGLNAWMGETQRRFAGVRGFATVHPEDDDPAAIVRAAIDDHGLVGLKLHAEVQKIRVDDPRLDGAFSVMEERRLPCVIHVGDGPYPDPPEYLSAKLMARRMESHPNLVAVIPHLGMFQTERFLEIMARHDSVHMDVSFTMFPGADPFDPSILAPFAGRMMFGSDFPNIVFSYADQLARWWEVDWVRRDPEAFFAGNARALIP